MEIEQITSAFNNYVSIKKIREVFPEISSNNFEFTKVTEECVENKVSKLNTKKSSKSGPIPVTILKYPVEIYLPFLTKLLNLAITENQKINSKNQSYSLCKKKTSLKEGELPPR